MKKGSKKNVVKVAPAPVPTVLPGIPSAKIQVEYEGLVIEVNPALSLDNRKGFCEGVWSMYWSVDKDGNYDYRPALYDAAIRLMTLYCYTDLVIDLNTVMDQYADTIMYSDLYEKIVDAISGNYRRDYDALCAAAKEYVDRQCTEVVALMGNSVKSEVDVLLGKALRKVNVILDKLDLGLADFAEASKEFPAGELIPLIKKFTEMPDSSEFVNKVLDFRDKKAEGTKDGGSTGKV